MSPQSRKAHAKHRLDELIRRAARSLDHHRDSFWRLIHVVRASSKLLSPANCQGRGHYGDCERFVSACALLSAHCHDWIRVPEGWTAPDASPWMQFHSLVTYLFAHYPVPRFMTRIWCDGRDQAWERRLYFYLARGLSVRRFLFPFCCQMTKAQAKWFMQAPDDLYPITAIRWAQVRSLDGDDRLARCLLRTILVAPSNDEAFWETVIRFLIDNGPLTTHEIEHIVNFVYGRRFRPAASVGIRLGCHQSPQTEFSLRRWSLSRLRRYIVNWEIELANHVRQDRRESGGAAWAPTPIESFRQVTTDGLWTIHELLTDRDLRVEGGIMQHCVARYSSACARRRTSIWSMRIHDGRTSKRVLTIEVVPETKAIRQAKGRSNSPPTDVAKAMLLRWANHAGLTFEGSI